MLFNASLEEHDFPSETTRVVALAPLDTNQFVAFWDATLFLITEDGVVPICAAPLPIEEDKAWGGNHLAPRLHLSPSGRFAALCHDFGRFGVVVDIHEKRLITVLNRGDYQPETQLFPVAFFQNEGRDLLVHATDWNRLEISDPQSGELLTPRDAMVHERGKSPEHYLDFFHGALLASPDGKWVADDGWAWHPIGVPTTWSLEAWLDKNVYESEDGYSRRELCGRTYLWNIPMAWADHEHLAVWGLGEDELEMLNGVRIFNVSSGEETATFAGPSKNAFFGGNGGLFSVEDDGLHIWNLGMGERLGRINGFKPRWQRGDFLIELKDNRVRSWNWRYAFD